MDDNSPIATSPTVFFVMFCSLRRLPAQMKVTGIETMLPHFPDAILGIDRKTQAEWQAAVNVGKSSGSGHFFQVLGLAS